jgi:four helix bundle protein
MSNTKPRDLCERTFQFARDIVAFCIPLSRIPGAQRQIAGQLLRAGTSVGANAEEARAAHGRRDFTYRNSVVLREARESRFWLRLIEVSGLVPSASVQALIQESNELVAIYITAVKSSKKSQRAS